MDVKFILSKYSPSISKDIFPFEFRTNPNIYSAESQEPEFYLRSLKPFDKNLCFYNIKLTRELKENLFPKEKYEIKKDLSQVVEKIDLDDLFGKVKYTTIDVFDKDFNIDNIEESIIKTNIKKIINENKIVPYEKKEKRQWFIIGMRGYGPYNDQEIYNFLIKINMSKDNTAMKSKLMVLEKISDIFYTVDSCLEELNKTLLIPNNYNIFPNMKNNNEKKEGNDFDHMKNSKEISRPVYTRRYSKFNDNNIQKILNNNDNKNQYYNNHFSLINNHPKLQRRISLNNYYNNKIFKKEFKQGNSNLNKNKLQRNYNRQSTYTKHLSELDKLFAFNPEEKEELNKNKNENVKEVIQEVDVESIFS
jgi:hypothetical protein